MILIYLEDGIILTQKIIFDHVFYKLRLNMKTIVAILNLSH